MFKFINIQNPNIDNIRLFHSGFVNTHQALNRLLTTSLLLLFLVLVSACGTTAGSLRNDPGYADLSYPSHWRTNKDVGLSLGPRLIGLLKIAAESDEERALLAAVQGLRIRSYNSEHNGHIIKKSMEESALQLRRDGWVDVIRISDESEHFQVFIKSEQDTIQGLVVLIKDDNTAFFVNLIGNIQPKDFQKVLSTAMNTEDLG
ncbi:MAG: hypothetical protein ACI93R_000914 [Flavobacteriales bacterium]|jgi:hypothetical protein